MSEIYNDNSKGQSSKNVERYSDNPLSSNVFFRITKKTEKIVTAIYMVTSLMSDQDIIRSRIRRNAISLLDDVFYCLETTAADKTKTLSQSIITIEHMMTLFSVAHRLGMISDMNHSILKKELILLQTSLYKDMQTNATLDYYKEPHTQVGYHNHLQEFLEESLKEIENIAESHNVTKGEAQKDINDTHMSFKNNVVYNKDMSFINTSKKRQLKPKRGESEKRQQLILDILKAKENVSMKDIATRITNCTEKTLQRDLMSLIKKGFVEKQGKKRWSIYVYKGEN